MASGRASVKKAGKVMIAASGSKDIVTTAKTTIKVKYFCLTTSLAFGYFLGAIQITRDTLSGAWGATVSPNNTLRGRGSTKVSRDIFCPFWAIIYRFELFIA